MVECWKQDERHLILPIFYFVDPRDVRNQQGPYQQAFEQHSHKHSSEVVNEWKEALQIAGEMKGWHVIESHGQGAIIGEVLSNVESHLRSMYTLVTDELVGIDTHVGEVMKLLNLGLSNEKVIVGIHGMGGLGKTTLSKAVYNKIFAQFDRCCYLEDVREALVVSNGAVSLQNKILSAVLKDDRQVKSVSEGINMIKQRVCKHKVLVVVDDIDDNFEFDKILGKPDDFSGDSRFIFTTRNKRALEFLPECKFYEPGELSYHLSLQLFSKHAFGMDSPPEEDARISDDFVKVATGLPLALKVIGSLLFRRERKFWKEKLIELQNIPSTTENKLHERLKISCNELTHNEMQIFLDIASHFTGSPKDLPYYMWSGCDFYPESSITTLINRSLIKVDKRNQFWMHDHIKDLGRAIIKMEDVEHPYNCSRIWSTDDALNMLRNGEGSERVEVLRINVRFRDDHEKLLNNKGFKNLPRLRYLEVHGGDVKGDFSHVLPNLCCLRLRRCGSIPTDINTKKLIVLDLERSSVKDNWKCWSRIQAAGKLKAINLFKCSKLTRTPDLSMCASLELINFELCKEMEGGLHIRNFKNLKTLRLSSTKITELIGKLQLLEEMDMRLTHLRELPVGMEKLSSLRILLLESELSRVNNYKMKIPKLPGSLKRLSISSPSGVPNLLDLKELESLSYLNASNPWIPGDLWRLPNLKELILKQCSVCGPLLQQDQEATSSAAALPPSLTSLHVEECGPLNDLPNLANLQNLTQLKLTHIGVVEISGLGELRALETMWISDYPSLKSLVGLENLLLLHTLFVGRCEKLERLPSVANLIKLKDLTVCQCPFLVEIQGLGDLGETLSRMEIENCPNFASLDGLGLLGSLEALTLTEQSFGEKPFPELSSLVNLPDLSALRNLKRLDLTHCESLIDLPTGFERLESLRQLVMCDCYSITKLPDLSGLNNLEELNLEECTGLVEVKGMEGLESLTQLRLFGCCLITEMPDLSGLNNLEILDLSYCEGLTEVKGVEGLGSLTMLFMFDCSSVKKLGNLSGLRKLKELQIEGCTKLTKVSGIEELDGLLILGMDKRMRLKHWVKSAARYGKGLAARFMPTMGIFSSW
ncbi:unnamed protein product [Linum tenue]|uniref:AAA+ ATPase domain-containing protein n=1 Tax=Linum tenue TaxID=586396 RepID=A0AAV0RAH1_9ROSI|nr:unnamed protein product [Linum tenue]